MHIVAGVGCILYGEGNPTSAGGLHPVARLFAMCESVVDVVARVLKGSFGVKLLAQTGGQALVGSNDTRAPRSALG